MNTYNLEIEAGATFDSVTLRYLQADKTPVDLTGYTAELQIRSSSVATALLTKAPEIDYATGSIPIVLTADETRAIGGGRFFWGIELSNGSRVIRLVQGQLFSSYEVVQ